MKRSALLVEELSFNSLWIADHFANPFTESDWLEAWTVMAGLAETTSKIRLGTLVTNIVYRHPAVIAKQAVTVDQMSSGRLDLGIGAGGAPTCHSMTGTPFWSGKERQERLAEFVDLVDQLLTNERTTFKGNYYQAEEALMRPSAVQCPRPALTVAAHGPKSMSVAAKHADTWSFYEPGAGLKGADAAEAMRKMNDFIDEKATEAGRDPAQITRSYCCGFAASSAWLSLEEALPDIELYQQAGINEFIFNYTPTELSDHEIISEQGEVLGNIEVTQLLNGEGDLRKLRDGVRRFE
jgi:alkanesulfonate monooxygenase SsuD/methylene tetrahydromethanopterin reductase-like flavin-dependent oxidoreductase (luciferase family)